jgi:hypothetical protein
MLMNTKINCNSINQVEKCSLISNPKDNQPNRLIKTNRANTIRNSILTWIQMWPLLMTETAHRASLKSKKLIRKMINMEFVEIKEEDCFESV